MRFSTLLSGALVVVGVIAAPNGGCRGKYCGGGWQDAPQGGEALSSDQVANLINGYTYLLEHPGGPDFNSTANAILAADFQVFSDSILYLSGRPLDGSPAYPSRDAFIATQFQTPPLPVVETLNYFYDSTDGKIGWRWRASGIGSNKYNISGLIDIDLEGSLIKTVYSEFNTGAFLFDLGATGCVPPPR